MFPSFPSIFSVFVCLILSLSLCWSVCLSVGLSVCLSAFHLVYASDFYEEYNTLELFMLCNSSLLTGSVLFLTSNVLRYFFKTADHHQMNVSNK